MYPLDLDRQFRPVVHLRRGFHDEFCISQDRCDRNDKREPIFPTAVPFDAAIEPHAISTYRFDFANRRIEKFGHCFHSYFPLPHKARGYQTTTVQKATQKLLRSFVFRFRVASCSNMELHRGAHA